MACLRPWRSAEVYWPLLCGYPGWHLPSLCALTIDCAASGAKRLSGVLWLHRFSFHVPNASDLVANILYERGNSQTNGANVGVFCCCMGVEGLLSPYDI